MKASHIEPLVDIEDAVENPFYKIDKQRQKAMNRISDPGAIVKPNGSNVDQGVLRKVMEYILEKNPSNDKQIEQAIRAVSKKLKTKFFTKIDLFYIYSVICKERGVEPLVLYTNYLQANQFRSQSGVMVYAVFTHPMWQDNKGEMKSFSCEYDCSFCPQQPNRPRSYVDGEPGLDRAEGVQYDTVKQIHTRATAYTATGHINDKAEVIVLGGTWHSYNLEYRRTFIRDIYYAANTIHNDRDRPRLSMNEEMELNETSKCRVIGLTIETRPDKITYYSLLELRKMGVTRVQLGLQHTDPRMLKRIKRRATPNDGIKAIKLLKDNCFKVDGHWMPDLPKPFKKDFEELHGNDIENKNLYYNINDIDLDYNVMEHDLEMFKTVIYNPEWQLDQWKIYPCEVVPWTEIAEDYKKGIHIPYGSNNKVMIEFLATVKEMVPHWIRLNRVIRDIPESYIQAGIKDTSGRQKIEKFMASRGAKCRCIRCREIKKQKFDPDLVKLKVTKYDASGGQEYFLEFVLPENEIIGFLRLRLSKNAGCDDRGKVIFKELVGCALIRELHIYGETTKVNRDDPEKNTKNVQHLGFGTRLLRKAFEIAQENGYKKIAVISGQGVKPYYRKFGFIDDENYLIKTFDIQSKMYYIHCLVVLIVLCAMYYK
jgi:histone acetyltransferase (RNA polymerase elongator complex component)